MISEIRKIRQKLPAQILEGRNVLGRYMAAANSLLFKIY
jgi:hypothetical protein